MRWRIFYGDLSTYSDEDGPPELAPPFNVQAVAEVEDGCKILVHGKDYYWFENGLWTGGDIFGLFDYLQRTGLVKFARTIPTPDFHAALKAAIAEEF